MVEVISNCAGTHTHHPALDVKRQQTKLKQKREDRGCFPSWVHFFLFPLLNKISVYGVGVFLRVVVCFLFGVCIFLWLVFNNEGVCRMITINCKCCSATSNTISI